uniref:Uncharacterized protein n=1 Tax=Daphnia galeata TaxID=27404 RepID=A0A8J2WLT6_9CRUS|nr:unnamed protein product [Daphnia galeata]
MFINRRWGKKCYQLEEKYKVTCWMERMVLRLSLTQEVKETVKKRMSSVCYPLGEVAVSMDPVNKWIIAGSDHSKILLKLNFVNCYPNLKCKNSNLSLKYYAKVLSDSLWIKMLDQKWKDYLSQLESQKSLLDGALLFSQSLQGSYMCPPNVEPLLIVIIERVKQLVAEMENNAFALKTTANNTKNAKKTRLCVGKKERRCNINKYCLPKKLQEGLVYDVSQSTVMMPNTF